MSIKVKFKTDYNDEIYYFEDSITIYQMINKFLCESDLREKDKNKRIWLKDKDGLLKEYEVGGYDFAYKGRIISSQSRGFARGEEKN